MDSVKPDFEHMPQKSLSSLLADSLSIIGEVKQSQTMFECENFSENLSRVINTLNTYDSQLRVLQCVLEGKTSTVSEQTQDQPQFILNSREEICESITKHFIDFVHQDFLTETHQIVLKSKEEGLSQAFIDRLQILTPKIEGLTKFFSSAVKFDQNDLFSISEQSERWQELKSHTNMVTINTAEQLRKSFERFLGLVYTGNAMQKVEQDHKNKGRIIKNVIKYLSGGYYFLFKEQAKKATHLFYSKPNVAAFDMWNTLDDKFILPFFEMTMTPININQLIYVPRVYPEITLDLVDRALENGTWNCADKSFFDASATFPLSTAKKFSLNDLTKKGDSKIQVRILSPVPVGPNKSSKGVGKLFSMFKNTSTSSKQLDTLIIHIHGGGFVAMSSGAHQIYLRHWANMTGHPIFSIDYRLAPTHTYPSAIDDCWQVYNWLIDNCQEAYGITPKKVILLGDSAGGNMSLALTLMAIKSNRKVPDGLFLAYPALNLNANAYSPSILRAVNDDVIPYSFLELCLQSYLPAQKYADLDPLVSPILASEDILKRMPSVRMVVGDIDPLHDECWRFLDRLVKAGTDAKLTIFKDLMHGFLNYDMPLGMPESLDCVKHCAGILKDLINLENREPSAV